MTYADVFEYVRGIGHAKPHHHTRWQHFNNLPQQLREAASNIATYARMMSAAGSDY
jgi:hypothetical protein